VNGSTEEKSSAMSQKPKELPFQGFFIQDKKAPSAKGVFFSLQAYYPFCLLEL